MSGHVAEVQQMQNCCRLCLAPNNECVSIYGSYFARDKESISSKISACLNIKITKNDPISTKICHICISYINCWQSYKERCLVAQRKQEEWLRGTNFGKSLNDSNNQKITHLNKDGTEKPRHIPFQVKEEPLDPDECPDEDQRMDEDDSGKCDIDPTQFLATDVIEEADELKRLAANKSITITKTGGGEGGPQILTSLGLQSITNENVNPFAFLSASLGASTENLSDLDKNVNAPSQKPHDCRICKMKFSTRANARRHERNLHALINDTDMTPLPLSTSQNNEMMEIQIPTSSTPKSIPRKNFKNAMTPEQMGIYDYENPEKYRHMLTPQRLAFIEEFETFLKQYQTLTCICCSKLYPKYKNFMAHMRKKYPRLPRACCFKCLKQFESKAIFVSHVKRRNCINLYKLYLSDPTVEKFEESQDSAKVKELIAKKFIECKLCQQDFNSNLDFQNHVNELHNDILEKKETAPPDTCGLCNLKIEDEMERKRHYDTLKCIFTIRCGICDAKFETQNLFTNHVYNDHVPLPAQKEDGEINPNMQEDYKISPAKSNCGVSIGGGGRRNESVPPMKTQFHSRMPQSCKICGARYNNYNNVLRHMEAKHPDQLPQTYKCSLCYVGFPRLSNLRDHMWDVHNKKLAKPKREAEIYCRICLEKFNDKDSWVKHQTEKHDRYICCICFSQYDDLTIFTEHLKIHTSLSYVRPPQQQQQHQPSSIPSSNTSQDSTKYTGRFDYVMKDLMSITNGSTTDLSQQEQEPSSKRPRMEDIKNDYSNDGLSNNFKAENLSQDFNSQPINYNINGNTNISPPKVSTTSYECKRCPSAFNSSQGLSNHMRAHYAQDRAANPDGFPMNNIKVPAIQPKVIRNNEVLPMEHRFRRMRCRMCAKRFSSKKVYRRHMLEDHQVQNVQFIHCSICKAEFAHEKGLKVHMMKVHGEMLKDIGTDNLLYECDICFIVYKTEEELFAHKDVVHNEKNNVAKDGNDDVQQEVPNPPTTATVPYQLNDNAQYWFQCRYCASNFDTNKKLAIHINIHDEVDSSDYSCKECGNVYSGRKSLWVHRYKKHPVVPSPSLCNICKKMFFTREHLEFHMQHLHKINGNFDSSNLGNGNETKVNENRKEIIHVSGEDIQTVELPAAASKPAAAKTSLASSIPQVPCSVCQMKFSDEEEFTKHMKIHEESLFTDNPLAAMFGVETEDPDSLLQKRINDNGEFVCDICPKTFQQLTALKVHRNWHFRSDGKQFQADPNIHTSFAKKRKSSTSPHKCQYCLSTFATASNLKRHINDLHKDKINELPQLPLQPEALKQSTPETTKNDQFECKKCNVHLQNEVEWIQHKINDARNNNSTEFNCDICEKSFQNKEMFLKHFDVHLDEIKLKIGIDNYNKQINNSWKKLNMNTKGVENESNLNNRVPDSDDNNQTTNDEKDSDSSSSSSNSDSDSDSDSSSDSDSENDDDDDDEDEDEDKEHDDEENDVSGPHSCDLCQITFDTAKELTAHVPTHFFHHAPAQQNLNRHKEVHSPIEKEKNNPKIAEKILNKDVPQQDQSQKEQPNEDRQKEKSPESKEIEKQTTSNIETSNKVKETVKETNENLITNIKKEIEEANTNEKDKTMQLLKVKEEIIPSDNSKQPENDSEFESTSDQKKEQESRFIQQVNNEKVESNDQIKNDKSIKQEVINYSCNFGDSPLTIASDSDDDIDDEEDYIHQHHDQVGQVNNDDSFDEDEDIEDNEYDVANAQPITLDFGEGPTVISEEIVHHDDQADYHENNVVDFDDDIEEDDDDEDEDDEGNIENYEHFIDGDDDDDEEGEEEDDNDGINSTAEEENENEL